MQLPAATPHQAQRGLNWQLEQDLMEMRTSYEVQVTRAGAVGPSSVRANRGVRNRCAPSSQLDSMRADQIELKARVRKLSQMSGYGEVFAR